MINSSIAERILGARAVATGSPVGDALENINTTTLDNGARAYVSGGAGAGEWQYVFGSTATADGTTIVAPVSGGAGRWFKRSAPASGSASAASAQYTISGTATATSNYALTETLDGFGFGLTANVVTVPSIGRYKVHFSATLTTTAVGGPTLYVQIRTALALLAGFDVNRPGDANVDVALSGHTLVDITDPAAQGILIRNGSAGGVSISAAGVLTIERISDIPA